MLALPHAICICLSLTGSCLAIESHPHTSACLEIYSAHDWTSGVYSAVEKHLATFGPYTEFIDWKVRCSRYSVGGASGVVYVTLGKCYPRFLRIKMQFCKFWSIVHNLRLSKNWHKSKSGICVLWTWSLQLYWLYDESICQKSFVTCCQPAYRGSYLTHWSTYYRACVERLMSSTSRYV